MLQIFEIRIFMILLMIMVYGEQDTIMSLVCCMMN